MTLLPDITWFVLALILVIPVQRAFHRHMQGFLLLLTQSTTIAFVLYSVLFFPGVALHEGSHWLAAQLLRVRTHAFSLLPRRMKNGTVRFGYVETSETDPVRAALIGLAPLISGALALTWLIFNHLGVSRVVAAGAAGDLESSLEAMRSIFLVPDAIVWLYLGLAISNTMFPSPSDRSSWLPALAIVVVLLSLAAILGWGQQILALSGEPILRLLRGLAGVFSITMGLDLLMIIPLRFGEWLLSRLTGLEIAY